MHKLLTLCLFCYAYFPVHDLSLVHDIFLRHQNVFNILLACVASGLVTRDPNRELDIYQVYRTLCDAGHCSYSQMRHDFRTFFLGYLAKVQGIPYSCRVI